MQRTTTPQSEHEVAATDFSLYRFLPYLLSITSEAVSAAVAGTYQGRFGLKTPEWRVLAVVAGAAEGLRQSDVSAATRMDKMTISRAVAALVTRGLIARHAQAGDRRTLRLRVSAEGRRLYDEVVPAALEVEARLLAGLSADAVERLTAALERLRAAAEPACGEP